MSTFSYVWPFWFICLISDEAGISLSIVCENDGYAAQCYRLLLECDAS